jgi:hypothetical protein
MSLDDARPEFRPLAPWPTGIHFSTGPTERVMQNRLPSRPDYRSYAGSTADLAANSEFAERSEGDFAAERRARDAERQRRKRRARAGAASQPERRLTTGLATVRLYRAVPQVH